jgi:hypothetical protein
MAFDKSMDRILWQKDAVVGVDRITVCVAQYGESTENKIGINRSKVTPEGDQFTKLGRLTKEEFDAILPILQEARQRI